MAGLALSAVHDRAGAPSSTCCWRGVARRLPLPSRGSEPGLRTRSALQLAQAAFVLVGGVAVGTGLAAVVGAFAPPLLDADWRVRALDSSFGSAVALTAARSGSARARLEYLVLKTAAKLPQPNRQIGVGRRVRASTN